MFVAIVGTFLVPESAIGSSKLYYVAREDGYRMTELPWQCEWQPSLSHHHAAEIVSR